MSLPLSAYSISSTDDVDQAQSVLSRELSNLRFESVQNRDQFRLDMNGVHLGKTLVAYNQFASETEVDAGVIEDAFIFSFCMGQPSLLSLDGERITARQGAMISPHKKLKIHRSAGSGMFIVRVSYEQIQESIRELSGQTPRQRIVFESRVDLERGVGRQLRHLVSHFARDSEQGSLLVRNPLLRKSFDELLLNTIVSLPHRVHTTLEEKHQPGLAPEIVHRAEAFLEAHVADAVTISDLVAECECGRRALFAAFQRHRGYTPMQFLANCRLQLAREALLRPSPGASVTTIALTCGFPHLGRFSAAYKQRYGESPSETLRRNSR